MNNLILREYSLLTNKQHKELLELRNKDYIRKQSLNQEKIPLQEHLTWVKTLQDDNNRAFFALIKDKKILGGVNLFDISSNTKWGIFIDKDVSMIIKSLLPIYFIDYIFQNYSVNQLYADIKVENTNALSYNKNLGFNSYKQYSDIVCMHLDKEAFLKAKNSKVINRIIKKFTQYNFKIEKE